MLLTASAKVISVEPTSAVAPSVVQYTLLGNPCMSKLPNTPVIEGIGHLCRS